MSDDFEAKFVAARTAGRAVRWEPPKCQEWDGYEWTERKECPHAPGYHEPSGAHISLPHGLRRNSRGASVWVREDYRRRRAIPLRTRENIAACAALGWSYWSDAPGVNRLWAVDDQQQAHEVRIDRKASKVQGSWPDGLGWRVEAYTVPGSDVEQLALSLAA